MLKEVREELKPGGNLEAELKQKLGGVLLILACSPWFSQPALFHNPRPVTQGDTNSWEWVHPYQSLIKAFFIGQSAGAFSLLRLPLPK